MADFKWYDGSKLGSYGTLCEVTLLAFAYVQHAESVVDGIGTVKSLFSQVCEGGFFASLRRPMAHACG